MRYDVRAFFDELFPGDAPPPHLAVIETPSAAPPVVLAPDDGIWGRQAAALLSRVRDDDRRQMFRDLFEERAGLFEYSTGLPRDEAERLAFEQVRAEIQDDQRDVA